MLCLKSAALQARSRVTSCGANPKWFQTSLVSARTFTSWMRTARCTGTHSCGMAMAQGKMCGGCCGTRRTAAELNKSADLMESDISLPSRPMQLQIQGHLQTTADRRKRARKKGTFLCVTKLQNQATCTGFTCRRTGMDWPWFTCYIRFALFISMSPFLSSRTTATPPTMGGSITAPCVLALAAIGQPTRLPRGMGKPPRVSCRVSPG